MFVVLGVVLVGAGEDNCAEVLDFVGPLIVFAVLEAVNGDGAGGVGEVEAHVVAVSGFAGVEAAYLTGEPVVGGAVGLDEIGHGGVRYLCLLLAGLEALDGGLHNLMLLLGGIVLVGAGEDYGAAVREFGSPFVVLAVLEAVNQDGSGFVGEVELHVVFTAVVGAGLEGRYLTGEPVVGVRVGVLDEVGHGAGSDFGLGSRFLHLAVKGVDVCALAGVLLHGFGGSLVFGEVAEDDDFVADLDVGVLALDELAVAKIIHLIGLEVFLRIGIVLLAVGDIEGGIAVAVAGEILLNFLVNSNLVDESFHIERLCAGGVVLGDVLHHPSIGLGGGESGCRGFTVIGNLRSGLGYGNAGVEKPCHEIDLGIAGLAAEGIYGDGDGGYTLVSCNGGYVKPILCGFRDNCGPGLGGGHFNLLGGAVSIGLNFGRVYRNARRNVFFCFLACCSKAKYGHCCDEQILKFH